MEKERTGPPESGYALNQKYAAITMITTRVAFMESLIFAGEFPQGRGISISTGAFSGGSLIGHHCLVWMCRAYKVDIELL